ncbi:endonuclease/exonuclease/phosphatase family protein [Paenibacillus apiarius]|uniref:endonuclease/exonuclease/phosphatase family protein n=1 Tax=Paenibacillus apiarius TaxID=46240 RepID=UPI003B3BBE5D
MEIKILTFNMHHGKGMDGKLDLGRIAHVIEDSEADLVGLNELDRCFSQRSRYIDQLDWLANRLHMYHAFGESVTITSSKQMIRQFGNAILSRYPIVHVKNHLMNVSSMILERRTLLESCVVIHGHSLTFYVTHLSLNPVIKSRQVDFIIKKLRNNDQPVILSGDLNLRPGTKLWHKMNEILADVCRMSHPTPCYTFPSFRPMIQLDYIFVSRHIRTASVEVMRNIPRASDHLPLKATLTLPDFAFTD